MHLAHLISIPSGVRVARDYVFRTNRATHIRIPLYGNRAGVRAKILRSGH